MTKRSFTLLEVMVAMVLLVIASGVIGMKMYDAVQKKYFQSELERLKARLLVSQRLAVAMQADWKGTLTRHGDEWIFDVACEEQERRKLAPLTLHSALLLDGKRFNDLTFDFFASGQVSPTGTLSFSRKSERVDWKLSEIYQRDEGKKLGPIHPAE
jgi:prepilin-type N-terminal cleavage/methylation domain-containing protein